jgi:hypothetical protein
MNQEKGTRVNEHEIHYPLEFINEIALVFSDNKEIITLANNNDFRLGRILNDYTDETITPEEILDVFEGPRSDWGMHNLYQKARRLTKYRALWSRWVQIVELEHDGDRTVAAIE